MDHRELFKEAREAINVCRPLPRRRVRPNARCPCGSGLKTKRCCCGGPAKVKPQPSTGLTGRPAIPEGLSDEDFRAPLLDKDAMKAASESALPRNESYPLEVLAYALVKWQGTQKDGRSFFFIGNDSGATFDRHPIEITVDELAVALDGFRKDIDMILAGPGVPPHIVCSEPDGRVFIQSVEKMTKPRLLALVYLAVSWSCLLNRGRLYMEGTASGKGLRLCLTP